MLHDESPGMLTSLRHLCSPFAVAVLAACAKRPPPPQPPIAPVETLATTALPEPAAPAPTSIAETIELRFDGINEHDAKKEARAYARDAVLNFMGETEMASRAIAGQHWGGLAAFPDSRVLVVRQFQQGNIVVFQAVHAGTKTGSSAGSPVAIPAINVPFLSICTFDDDHLIKEDRIYYDLPTFAAQRNPEAKPGSFRPVTPAPTGAPEVHTSAASRSEKANATLIAGVAGPMDRAVAALSALLPDTAAYEDVEEPAPQTGRERKAHLAALRNALPHATLTTPHVWAFDDYVVAEYVVSGMFEGDLVLRTGRLKPTQKPLTYHAGIVAQFAGGKIVHAWEYGSGSEITGQLLPAPPGKL
jgi:ketosteroid isomerase-like protein